MIEAKQASPENVRREIIKQLTMVLEELGFHGIDLKVEHAGASEHGDYTTNAAMRVFPKLKEEYESPLELAEAIKDKFDADRPGFLVKTMVVKPGFINFFLSEDYLFTVLGHFSSTSTSSVPQNEKPAMAGQTNQSKSESASKNELKKGLPVIAVALPDIASRLQAGQATGRRVMIEFTDPNPFKELHIGHLYSNVIGESLSRLFEAVGAQVWRVNYQGDVGMHVAKALWGLYKIFNFQFSISNENLKSEISKWEVKSLGYRVKMLGEAYAKGAAAYEEDPQAAEEIRKINKQVFDKDPEIMPLYETGRKWSMDYFEKNYARLGTKFDRYYPESEVGPIGKEIVLKHLKKSPPALQGRTLQGKSVFEESEGAIIFPGKKFGLHNRVFINSLGLPTYEAKELGLAPTKYKEFPYDISIIVAGNEIYEYFKVLLEALRQINPDLAAKTKHLSHGMVRLPEGKMSSRTGNVVTVEWLLDEAKRQIKERFEAMDEDTLEMVGVGAIKYALLKASIGRDIAFSFEESISLEGNSGPYIQYTFARTQSVLAKVKSQPFGSAQGKNTKVKTENQIEPEEREVLRKLEQFTSIVEKAVVEYAPHVVCTYLFELAQAFNLFYQKHKVVGSETEAFRAALTKATGNVLAQGLHLLGIKAPERM